MNRRQREKRLRRRLYLVLVLTGVANVLLAAALVLRIVQLHPQRLTKQLSDSTRAADLLFPDESYPEVPSAESEPPPPLPPGTPRLALVVDDFGNQWRTDEVQGILHLDIPLTLAVIPGLWASDRVAKSAHELGKEVIAHVPMAPVGHHGDLEPHLLSRGMSDAEVRQFLDRAAAVPYAVGLNNHMGSSATQDSVLMRRVARWCKRRGWYMLDSITHPATVLYRVAREEGVAAARRDIFLDHVDQPSMEERALKRAVRLARRLDRPVVVIAHPRPSTWHLLRDEVPRLVKEGVHFVPLSQAVEASPEQPRSKERSRP